MKYQVLPAVRENQCRKKEIRLVGETREISVDIQLISATNGELTGAGNQRFRADHEQEIILAACERHQRIISAVSRDLGISINKVYKKLKEGRQIG